MAPNLNLIVRPLRPLLNAIGAARTSLYTPPRSTIAGVDASLWPNPLQPVSPMGPPNAEPLGFNFDWGQNLQITPRQDAFYSAAALRTLATYPLARVCIENNKDVLTRIPRRVQLRAKVGENYKQRADRSKNDPILKKLNKFFDRPNSQQDWGDFLRPVLEDLLVIDAPSIFVERAKTDASVVGLRWVEGASITVKVEEHGWIPAPPSPAYQQNWQGYPRVDLTTDQLVYRPRNIVPRNFTASYLYGMSPTEQMAEEIRIGQARLNFVEKFYSEGTIPGMMLFAPVGTPPDKIKEAQQWIDSDLSGALGKRRRLQIFQGFQTDGKTEQTLEPKEPALADIFDENHIRKICYAYGTSPTRLQRAMNRSSGQQVQEASEEEGLLPWLNWLKRTCDYIIQVLMGYEDYEFMFDPFMENDALKQAMADKEDITIGLYSRNEKRIERGDDPGDSPEMDEYSIVTQNGVIPLSTSLPEITAEFAPPPAAGAGGTSGGRTPKGGKQPKATARVAASTSLKTNGHSNWNTCDLHKDSYPREFCSDCIKSEIYAQARGEATSEEVVEEV